MHTTVVVNDLTSAALSLSAFCGQANAPIITKESLPSRRVAPLVEGERGEAESVWISSAVPVTRINTYGGFPPLRRLRVGISERVPYKSSRILLCLWHSLFEWYSVFSSFSSSPPPVFSRKHFPAVEIQILVYGSDSSFQNVPDRWGAPYNGECL